MHTQFKAILYHYTIIPLYQSQNKFDNEMEKNSKYIALSNPILWFGILSGILVCTSKLYL